MIRILDHADRAKARVAEQFKASPRLLAFLGMVGDRAQALETEAYNLSRMDLDAVEGAPLEALGLLIGQGREGLDDDEYRAFIRARIGINRSSGSIPDIKRAFDIIIPGNTTTVTEWFPAQIEVFTFGSAITTAFANLMLRFLRLLRAAGIMAVFRWSETASADTFSFYDCPDGLGFGDSTNPATGGGLSGAAA